MALFTIYVMKKSLYTIYVMKKSLYTIYVMKIRKNNGNYKTSLVPYTNINNEFYLGISLDFIKFGKYVSQENSVLPHIINFPTKIEYKLSVC